MKNREYSLIKAPSDALVIHCVDHRFQKSFREFIVGELGIEIYNPVVIAGGALALSSEHPSRFGYIWDQVDYFITEAEINTLVLINHEDCKWYEYEHPDFKASELRDRGRSDLSEAAQNVKAKYPSVEIYRVWAEIKGDTIRFTVLE